MLVQVARNGIVGSSDLKLPEFCLTDYNHQDIPVIAQADLNVSLGNGPSPGYLCLCPKVLIHPVCLD
jgi:hypothetical protein